MPATMGYRRNSQTFAIMILVVGLTAAWFAYAPGLGGTTMFDDQSNLSRLKNIQDAEGALGFIVAGTAGPLGRPIALASFVPQAYAWPDSPEVFLRTNILIHLANGALVTWFLYLLGRAREKTEQQAALTAAVAGVIWMLTPLLASSSLLIVQRMTTLAAMFMLLGAIGYMYARRTAERSPARALCGMSIALCVGAMLAMFTKENGVLLFLYILAAEVTLLNRPLTVSRRLWRIWFSIFLITPLAGLSIYLATALPYPETVILRRDFDGFERLITQAEILWRYLYLAFLPNLPSLGPFHDHFPIRRSILEIGALLSTSAWLVLITAAVALRRRVPLFSFAVAWYLLGHLLESTTLGLELYYEHRNYLPLVGPVYAVIASLMQLEKRWRRLAGVGMLAYASLLGGVLFTTTSLWGSPTLAAEIWQLYNPESLRATQHLAAELERDDYSTASRRLLTRYAEANPQMHGVHLQILVISCQIAPTTDHSEAVSSLEEQLPATKFDSSVLAAFEQLYSLVKKDQCGGVDNSAVYRIGQALLQNPRFNSSNSKHNIHAIMASIGIDQRNFDLAVTHMEQALTADHNSRTLLLAIRLLNSGGRYDKSWELLTEAKTRPLPRHPFRAAQWEKELDRIESALLSLDPSRGKKN